MKLILENWNNFLNEKCRPGDKFDGETGKPCPAGLESAFLALDSKASSEAKNDLSKLLAQIQAYHKKAPAGDSGHDEVFSPLWRPWMDKSKQLRNQFKAALKANVTQNTPETEKALDKVNSDFGKHINTLPQLAVKIFQTAQKQNIQLGREVTGMLLKAIKQQVDSDTEHQKKMAAINKSLLASVR